MCMKILENAGSQQHALLLQHLDCPEVLRSQYSVTSANVSPLGCDSTLSYGSEYQMGGYDLAELKGDTANEDGLTMGEYMLLHTRCAICHWPQHKPGRTLQLHHIQGGAGRKNPPSGINWICLCDICHGSVHGRIAGYEEIPRGAVLTAKEEEDGFVDEAGLAALKGRVGLPYDKCPIPDQYLEERKKHSGFF